MTAVHWAEFDRRADGIAAHLLEAGARAPGKVAQYLYNCPEYLEIDVRRVQGRLRRSTPTTATPTTSSSTCGTTPTPSPSSSTARSPTGATRSAIGCPKVTTWLWVDDGTGAVPRLGHPVRDGAGEWPPTARSPRGAAARDDLYILYTGGTTGMPKGVMWRQDDLFGSLDAAARSEPIPASRLGRLRRHRQARPGSRNLPAAR